MGEPVIAAPALEVVTSEPAFLARVRLRARRRVLWLRHLWATGHVQADQSLAISHAEIDRLLADPASMTAAEAAFRASDPHAVEFAELVHEADVAFRNDPAWETLRLRLGLGERDVDLLSLAVACELRPELTRLFGYLQDDVSALLPSASLAATLFDWPSGAAVAAGTALVDWVLARPVKEDASAQTDAGWTADPAVVAWLIGSDEGLPVGTTLLDARVVPGRCLYPAELAAMDRFVETAVREAPHAPVVLELVGVPGSGRGVLAAQLAATMGRPALIAEPRDLDPGGQAAEQNERAIGVARSARLAGALLYWRNADRIDPAVWNVVRDRAEITVAGVAAPSPTAPGSTARSASFRLPLLARAARLTLWHELTDDSPPESIAGLLLTPGEIAATARAAAVSPAAAEEACRRQIEVRPGELLAPLPCPYSWDDIVLPNALRRHLQEFERQARWRWEVYEDWGFERLVPLGRGLSALFAGPSGTGKTMAAQVLARSLGLDLYRIDLAGVVNKYIGETEKRLKQVFDSFERAAAVVLFDEADALFGRRAQVKDAHDRYANIEIDYLLQRMERFEGIAVLATNRKEDLDRAFLRRLRFVVDFLRPGPAERLTIWRLALPEQSPSGEPLLEGIDFGQLAERLSLTGAGIKAAALAAAFLARAESRRIRMDDVLAAARRELAKQGAEMRPGDWEQVR